jgi:glutaredoxin
MKYTFTILYNSECNFWKILKVNIEQLAKEIGYEYEIQEVFVHDDEEAKRWKFAGSPQLLINGEDIDPAAPKITNYHAGGCRPVFYKGMLYEYIPIELIKDSLI